MPVATNSLRRKEIINEGREGIRQEMKVRWWGDKGAREWERDEKRRGNMSEKYVRRGEKA